MRAAIVHGPFRSICVPRVSVYVCTLRLCQPIHVFRYQTVCSYDCVLIHDHAVFLRQWNNVNQTTESFQCDDFSFNANNFYSHDLVVVDLVCGCSIWIFFSDKQLFSMCPKCSAQHNFALLPNVDVHCIFCRHSMLNLNTIKTQPISY